MFFKWCLYMFQSKLASIAFQVVSIVMFALISAAVPQYAWIVFIAYFAVLMIIMTRLATRGMKKASELKGTPLFKEENAVQIMASDIALMQEIKDQLKSTMLLMVMPLMVLLIAPLYWQYINPFLVNTVLKDLGSEFLIRFIGFLLFYTFLIVTMFLPRLVVTRKLKQKKQLYTPRVYSVYKNGLYMDGRMVEYDKESCYQANSRRKFVEIHSPKLQFIVRLYTLEVSALAGRLREVGLYECRE